MFSKKWTKVIIGLSLAAMLPLSCQKWDLEKESFLEVHTKEVVAQTNTSITIKGEISGLAGKGKVDQHGIAWSYTNTEPTIEDERKEEGSRNQDGTFQSELSDLAVNTPLYARAFARSGSRLVYGEVIQVQPTPLGLSITMDSIRTDNASKVTLYGRVQGLAAGLSFSTHGFVWDTVNQLPTVELNNAVFLGSVNNADLLMQSELPDPEAQKTYYVRAFVISGSQALYSSNVLSFTKGNAWRLVGDFPLEGAYFPNYHFFIEDQLYVSFPEGFGIYDPEDNTWEPKSSDYPKITEAGAFAIDQEGFVGAGRPVLSKCWKYSATADSWTPIADFPTTNNTGSLGFSVDDQGYIGLNRDVDTGDYDKKIYRYDPAGDQWLLETTADPSAEILYGYISFKFEDHVSVGMAFFALYPGLWSYYPSTGTWTQNADFPILLSAYETMNTFTIGDKGYLILPDQTDNFWEYNSSTDSWRQRSDFPGAPRNLGLTFSKNGKGYYGLGKNFLTNGVDRTIWEYIPDVD